MDLIQFKDVVFAAYFAGLEDYYHCSGVDHFEVWWHEDYSPYLHGFSLRDKTRVKILARKAYSEGFSHFDQWWSNQVSKKPLK